MFNISAVDSSRDKIIQQRIDQKTKPLGALGALEGVAFQLAKILENKNRDKVETHLSFADPIALESPVMLVFAGDHGIAEENVSIAPSAVTQQMVKNFIDGGAAINCFCRCNDIKLEIIDAGMLLPLNDPKLTCQSLGKGTNNFIGQLAMSMEQVNRGLEYGKKSLEKHLSNGCNLFAFGEMGIANTSSASAIQSLLLNEEANLCVGRGTGIDEATYERKVILIERAVEFHRDRLGQKSNDPYSVLSAVGGFEIVQMVGAMLAAAEKQNVILVDGFIATVAALLATKMYPTSRQYMIFCHQSEEQGHRAMLKYLDAVPLLDLGLRLGEGTGAALAVPLIRAAASFYNDMASFESAGVTAV